MGFTAQEYAERATECRRKARTESGKAREMLLEMAQHWERLANQARDLESKKALR